MRLDEYLHRNDLRDAAFAKKVRAFLPRGARTNFSTINRLRRDAKRKQQRCASPTLALAIEHATGGEVKAEELPLTNASKRLLRALRAAAGTLPAAQPEPTPAGDAAA